MSLSSTTISTITLNINTLSIMTFTLMIFIRITISTATFSITLSIKRFTSHYTIVTIRTLRCVALCLVLLCWVSWHQIQLIHYLEKYLHFWRHWQHLNTAVPNLFLWQLFLSSKCICHFAEWTIFIWNYFFGEHKPPTCSAPTCLGHLGRQE